MRSFMGALASMAFGRVGQESVCPLGEQPALATRAAEPRLLLSSNLPFKELQECVPTSESEAYSRFCATLLRQAPG